MATNDNTRTGEIIEHYRLMSVLGTGSTSVVYLGQRLDNPQVTTAIKVLTFHATLGLGEQMAFRARFLREARAVSRLHHEHILPVLGYGEVDELTYMVLPLVASGTLAARLAQAQAAQTQLSLTHVADILNQLASALDYAHAQGIVHRDVKPSNVLVGDHAQLYLTDFGIARLVESGSNGLTIDQGGALTAAGQVLGTTYYMAPEQIRGEKVGPAADIYALGIVAFQLATGQLPYQGDTPLAVALQHLQENPATRPSLLRPDLPPSVEHAILRALAKRPADRFPSAGMFAQAFEQSLPTVHPATRQGPIAAPGDGASDSRTAWPLDEPGSLPPGRQSTDVTDTTAAGAQAAGATGGESADLGIERMARSARWYQPLVGTTLGSYRLDQLQAVSDIGALFRARGLADGAAYRVRVLSMPADLSAQARGALLARFQQTAHAVSELQHPYILPLVDYGSTPRWLYVVSPQVAGPTLGEQIAQTGSMTLRVVERYLGQLAAALEYAHDQGVLHTNLRVDCIYLSDTPTSARGSVLVAEFETRRMGELAREP
ncbi:MAG TPA: protein kinase, partial [Ktedonobacterales bacterium]